MKQTIIIIGGGIVGATAAFYLSKESQHQLILIDHGLGNATRAAAGIICPWLSQRRNKDWYRLTSQGADFYQQLMTDLASETNSDLPYRQTGTLVFKNKPHLLEKLYHLAQTRRQTAQRIGELTIFDGKQLQEKIPPLQTEQGAVLASGGGRVDGAALVDKLLALFCQNGGRIVHGEARLLNAYQLEVGETVYSYDQLIVAAGAWLPQTLSPLGYQVDVRPQKGQLLEIETGYQTDTWPGCMLHGEIDILPFEKGKLVIGASHEDDMGYDLTVDPSLISQMKQTAHTFLPALAEYPVRATRVGIRAYTSDYSPFYGSLAQHPHIWCASGLGSSGLTSGPFIGWQLAQLVAGKDPHFDREAYSPNPYIIPLHQTKSE